MRLTRESMLERMAANDSSFDGRFIVGVHSTKIYCLPSCKARLPKPENVKFYDNLDEARNAGLRSCKRCQPDNFYAGHNPEKERILAVLADMRANPSNYRGVDDLARAAAMSPSSFFTATRNLFHTTPGTLLSSARIEKAQSLLQAGMEASQAGFEVGFESNSAFYENFGRRTGMPPAQYGRLAPPFTIELPADFARAPFLALIGRDPGSVTERITDDGLELVLWSRETPVKARAEFTTDGIKIDFDESANPYPIHAQVVRLLGLEQEPRSFEDHIRAIGHGRLIEGREGLRIPQTPTVFDGFVWCIVGQQVNLPFAFKLRRVLAELQDIRVEDMLAPPRPEWLATIPVEELTNRQFSTRKAEYLIGVSQSNLTFDPHLPKQDLEAQLLSIRGIGPWAANYLMMRSFAAPDCVPLGDTRITSALAKYFGVDRPDAKGTTCLMEPFRPYRSLACYHLWRSLHIEN